MGNGDGIMEKKNEGGVPTLEVVQVVSIVQLKDDVIDPAGPAHIETNAWGMGGDWRTRGW